jgi:elongation factor P
MKANEVRKGTAIMYNHEICIVTEAQHRTPGNLRAFMQLTMKGLKSGRVFQNRFAPDNDVERVILEPKNCQFLYKDDNGYHFMEMETYDSFALKDDLIGDGKYYLKENMELRIFFEGEKAIMPELPKTVVLKVTEAPPGIRGDSVSNTLKSVTCETGLKLNVPLFIDEGTLVKVNTDTGDYLGRAQEEK